MKYYFNLQIKRISRGFVENGIHPILGYSLSIILLIAFSLLVYQKTDYADWIMILVFISTLSLLDKKNRITYLNLLFQSKHFYLVRIAENLLIYFPFALVLSIHNNWLALICGFLFSLLATLKRKSVTPNKTFFTPYKRGPFEYISGFRKSFVVLIIPIGLLYQSIRVDNPNLGLASILIVFILGMTFYLQPENRFYIWIHAQSAQDFLFKKIKQASVSISLLVVPFLIVHLIFFQENLLITGLIFVLGYLFQITIILGKYSAYPRDMSVPQAIFIGLSVWFPPLLLIVIPMFFKSAKQNLNPILP